MHLTEALTFRRDPDLISSTVRAIIATLKSGEKCNVEPELISKGMVVLLLSFLLQQQVELPAQQGRAYCAGCGTLPSAWIRKCELI